MSFQWSDECEERFQKIKTLLTSAPVLTLPEEGVDFTVYCDASGDGLGGVLMQKGRVMLGFGKCEWEKKRENMKSEGTTLEGK